MAMTASELKGELIRFACQKAQRGTRKLLHLLEAKCVALEAKRHKSGAGEVFRSAGEVVSQTVGAVKDLFPTKDGGKEASDAVETVKDAAPVQEVKDVASETVGAVSGALGGAGGGKDRSSGEEEGEEAKAQEGGKKERAKADGEDRPSKEDSGEHAGNGEEKRAKAGDEARASKEGAEKSAGNGSTRGYIGLTTYPVELPEGLADELGTSSGLILLAVEPDSPADEAGLLLGDTLVKLDGDPVQKRADLVEQLESHSVGDSLQAEVLRAGEAKDFTLEVGNPP